MGCLSASTSAARNKETEIQLRADTTVPYGKVVELMGIANKAGLARIGFVTEAAPRVDATKPVN